MKVPVISSERIYVVWRLIQTTQMDTITWQISNDTLATRLRLQFDRVVTYSSLIKFSKLPLLQAPLKLNNSSDSEYVNLTRDQIALSVLDFNILRDIQFLFDNFVLIII